MASTVRVGLDEQQPGPVDRSPAPRRPSGSTRQRVVEPVEGRRRAPRGSAPPGAARAARRRLATTRGNSASARSRSPSLSWESSAGSNVVGARDMPRSAALRSIEADPGVGVLHVEDRVVAGLPGDLGDVERQRRVGRVAGQRVAQRVDADQRRPAPASVTIVPARLDSRSSSPSCMILTSWPISTSRLYVGSSPAHARHRLQPPDVAVVVGAEQVDADVEARARACRGSRRCREAK